MILCEDETYKEAAEFYASKLGIPEDTIIAINLYEDTQSIAGYCEYHEEDVIPYFLVGIDETDYDGQEDDPISVLAHEMVHVKQYVKGELVDHGRYCSWHGKKYAAEVDINSEEYFFSPWEVEAYGMQVGLYRMYLESIPE